MTELNTNLVLVTGPLGWAGSRLVETLTGRLKQEQGAEAPAGDFRVRCLVLDSQDTSRLSSLDQRVEIVRGDLRRIEDCERFCAGAKDAIIFHTAGVIHPRRIREFYEVNVRGAENLVKAAVNARVRRIVALSSNSPCGCNPHPDHVFDELSPYHPYLNYGRSKMQMELVFKREQNAGRIETVLIRPPWFYGPNQPPRQSLFFRMIRDGKVPIVGSGENLRSMVYVDNLCAGMLLAAGPERANGETYWIADEQPYSMNEIIATIERLLEGEFGRKCAHRRLRLPHFTSSVAFAADLALQGLGLYHQKVHVLSEMGRTIACWSKKAEQELGYRPRIALEEGMRRSLAWCAAAGMEF